MAKELVISSIFKAKDKDTIQAFRRVKKEAGEFGRRANRAFREAARSARMFKSVLGGVLAGNLISRAFMGLSLGARAATQEFLDFDQAVTQASAKFPGRIQRGTDAYLQLEKSARQMGATTEFTAAQAGQGLNFLAMAGFNADQAMAALPGLTDLATVGFMDLGRASDIATNILGAFRLTTEDTVQLSKNLARVNDVLARTMTRSNVDMEEIATTMEYVGPVAANTGTRIESLAAAIGFLGNAGLKADKAGTSLRTAFINLQAPTAEARGLIKKLKIEVANEAGETKDLLDLLNEVRTATKDMGSKQRAAAVKVLFGKRAIAGMNVLLAASNDELKEFRDMLDKAKGASNMMAEDIRKSLTNKLLTLKSAAVEVGIKFLKAFSGDAVNSIEDITEAIRKFKVKPVVKEVKDFIKVLKDIKPLIKPLVGLYLTWKAYTIGLGIAHFVLGKELLLLPLGALIKSLKGVALAQWAWNLATMANPVGLITIAVLGLGAALGILIWKNKEVVSEWEIGFHMIEYDTRIWVIRMKKLVSGFINWQADAINKGLGKLGISVKVPTIDLGIDEDIKKLNQMDKMIKGLKEEAAGLGVQRGRAGIRGAAGIKGHKKEKKPLMLDMPKKMGLSTEMLEAARRQEAMRKAPSVQQAVIDFYANISAKDAPPGTQVETKVKTKGARRVNKKTLGVNP